MWFVWKVGICFHCCKDEYDGDAAGEYELLSNFKLKYKLINPKIIKEDGFSNHKGSDVLKHKCSRGTSAYELSLDQNKSIGSKRKCASHPKYFNFEENDDNDLSVVSCGYILPKVEWSCIYK